MEQVVSNESIAAATELRTRISDKYKCRTRIINADDHGPDGTRRRRMWTVAIRKDVEEESSAKRASSNRPWTATMLVGR